MYIHIYNLNKPFTIDFLDVQNNGISLFGGKPNGVSWIFVILESPNYSLFLRRPEQKHMLC